MDSSSGATPRHPAQSASHSDARLRQGLTALAQQNDEAAIALLTAVLDSAPSPTDARRARIGLVKAHQHRGEISEAIAHCQPLLNAAHPPTRDWSHRAFAALQKSASRQVPETGFVPLAPTTAEPSKRVAAKSASGPLPSPTVTASRPSERRLQPKGRPSLPLPWRRASRAQRWTPLPDASVFEQGVISLWTLLSFIALPVGLQRSWVALSNYMRRVLWRFFYVPRWWWLENIPVAGAITALLALWAASPWILQGVLQLQGAKPIAPDRLSQMSPEAGRLLKRLPVQPKLYSLPVDMPLVMGFGLFPRPSWLVISDGLRQLEDEEVAALIAAELSHLKSWTTAFLTLVVAAAQIPHTLYWSLAAWGNRLSIAPLRGAIGAAASLCYGLFWLLRWPSLWLSRWRRQQSDRLAVGLTGNPNALARALVTVSAALATERRRRPELGRLDALAPLLPVSPEAALPLGQLTRRTMPEPKFYQLLRQLLQWPCPMAHRRWLLLNQTHPPLDERLRSLMTLAARWRLDPEITDLPPPQSSLSGAQMLLQTAPYWGGIAGAGVALLLWGVGGAAGQESPLGWLWRDSAIMQGLTAIGISTGMLARVNPYFPDIPAKASTRPETSPEATDVVALSSPLAAPVQSVPVVLQGRLLGPRGLQNSLGQDLLLDASGSLMRLSFISALGPVGNLLLGPPPHRLIGRTVTVTGWLHRGATAWVDVERISAAGAGHHRHRAGDRLTCAANHPIWSTLIAAGLALWGAWTIYRGV